MNDGEWAVITQNVQMLTREQTLILDQRKKKIVKKLFLHCFVVPEKRF